MSANAHKCVIIVGIGLGKGTRVFKRLQSGKKIFLLERGGWHSLSCAY